MGEHQSYKEAPVEELRRRIAATGVAARTLMETAKEMADSPDSAQRQVSTAMSMCITVLCGTLGGQSPEAVMEQFDQRLREGRSSR